MAERMFNAYGDCLRITKYFFLFILLAFVLYACRVPAVREAAKPHPVTEHGMIASALYAAERSGSDDVTSNILRRIALLKVTRNDRDAAFEVAQKIPTQNQRERTVADIALWITERGEHQWAQSVAEHLESDFHKSRVAAAVSVAYERAGEYRRGRELAETIPDPNFQARAFSGIAVVYRAAGYSDLASRLFNQAINAAGREQSITHHIETLLHISQKYREADMQRQSSEMVSRVMGLLDQITSEQHLLTVWSAVLDGYAQAGQNHSIIEKAVEAAYGANVQGSYIRDEILSRAAIACARAELYDRMSELLGDIGDVLLRTTTTAHIAVIFGDMQKRERADMMLTRALSLSDRITGSVFKRRALREIGGNAAILCRFDTVDVIIDILGDPRSLADVAAQAASSAFDHEHEDLFRKYMNKIVSALDSADNPVDRAEILFDFAALYERSGSIPDESARAVVSKVLYAVE
jgi:tetratricopeptide (TPR) repeat protein